MESVNGGTEGADGVIERVGTLDVDYAAAFLFSLIIIAIFSRSRLLEIYSSLEEREYRLINRLNASEIAGQHAFRFSYICYLLMLAIVFFAFCLFEPIADSLLTSMEDGFEFDDPAWPIAVALILVGVTPSTHFLKELELAIRRLAQRAADIPERFLDALERLEELDVFQPNLQNDRYRKEQQRYYYIENLLHALGHTREHAEGYARAVLSVSLFRIWTDPNTRPSIWSSRARNNVSSILQAVSEQAVRSVADIDDLISLTKKSLYIQEIQEEAEIGDWSQPLEPDQQKIIERFFKQNEAEGRGKIHTVDLLEQWESRKEDVDIAYRETSGAFVILATNDKAPSKWNDKLLNAALEIALYKPKRSALNSSLFGLFLAFGLCFLSVALLSFVLSFLFERTSLSPDAINYYLDFELSLQNGTQRGLEHATMIFVQFCSATLAAIALRYSRQESDRYTEYVEGVDASAIQSIWIVVFSTLAAFFLSVAWSMAYSAFLGLLNPDATLDTSGLVIWVLMLLPYCIAAGLYGLAVCVVADRIRGMRKAVSEIWNLKKIDGRTISSEEKKEKVSRLCRKSMLKIYTRVAVYSILISVIAFVVLVNHPHYDISHRSLWYSVVGVLVFAAAGLISFATNMIGRKNGEETGSEDRQESPEQGIGQAA